MGSSGLVAQVEGHCIHGSRVAGLMCAVSIAAIALWHMAVTFSGFEIGAVVGLACFLDMVWNLLPLEHMVTADIHCAGGLEKLLNLGDSC